MVASKMLNELFLTKIMIFHALYSLFFLIHILSTPQTTTGAAAPAYTATDLILLNCGASTTANDTRHRSWDGDDRSRYVPSNAAGLSSSSDASVLDPSAPPVPYQTARLFSSPFTYTFPVTPGPKFLRLYFYPAAYSGAGADASESFFTLTANSFTLARNFSAFLHARSLKRASFMKEFVITITAERQRLDLTFTPNPNTVAFVNGIEIVSIPDGLYIRGAPLKFSRGLYVLSNNTALENLYRLNVGGARVEIENDSGSSRGMFRGWNPDDEYIAPFSSFGWTPHLEEVPINYTTTTPPYSAPAIVYTTGRIMNREEVKGLEWLFPVDAGFYYLLRLHFCEFLQEIRKQNQRVFSIYINKEMVEIDTDVVELAGGPQIPIFMDYIALLPHGGENDHLQLSLFPFAKTNPQFLSALLNGVEIFKLNDSDASFAVPNPELVIDSSPPSATANRPGKKKNGSVIYAAIGSLIGVLAAVAVVAFLILRRRRKVKDSGTSVTKSSWMPISIGSKSRSTTRSGGSGVSLPADICRSFSIGEIAAATRSFDEKFIIGRGGFGNVYKGLIDNAATTVAIKRLNPSSSQGAREFLTEIEMLSKLRHHHLVSLIGYCDDGGEMILVYDYMAHGTLRDHLYNSENSPLTWKQRLQICLGAAKGLDYLHAGAKHVIIHRDVKSTNILLDDKLVAKVSDFGLSKVGPAAGAQTHVSTVVKGSFGYVDPEYYRRQQLTLKSDVYSFGVVLFEILCARPPIIPNLPKEQVNLGEWAKFCFRKGTLDQIIDSNLHGQIAPECLSKFVETGVACLKDRGIDRPSMNDIVWSLEFALQLQESADGGGEAPAAVADGDASVAVPFLRIGASTTTEEGTFSGSKTSGFSTSGSERFKSGDAFSELMNPTGR